MKSWCENLCRPYGAALNYPLDPGLRLRLRRGLSYFAPMGLVFSRFALHRGNKALVLTQTLKRWFAQLTALLLLAAALPLAAQDLASYEKRVSVKTLSNGLTVVLWRRPEAPVFSFFTMVDAGSAQDPLNETGLAHMMEHMAFKGTPDIGTTDYAAEKPALAKVEQTYAAYEAERIKRVGQDPKKLAAIEEDLAGRDQSRRQVRDEEPVRRSGGEPWRRRRERLHQLRRDRLHVLPAVEPD